MEPFNTDRLQLRAVNTDKQPEALQGGEFPYGADMRLYNNEVGQLGYGTPNLGMIYTGFGANHMTLGMFEDVQDNTLIGFFKDQDTGEDLVSRYYPLEQGTATAWQAILQGDLGFEDLDFITGVSKTNQWLGWTDNRHTGRLIDLEKGNKTGKRVEFTILFGKPEPGVNDIFVSGTEFRMTGYSYLGVPLPGMNNILVWQVPNTTYENDLLAGATQFAEQFNNSGAGNYFSAKVCGCGEVKVTELNPSGRADGRITTATITTTGTAPVLLVYDNIYPPDTNDISFMDFWRLRCPPNYEPVAEYKTDTTTVTNNVSQNVFKFQYRFIYDGGAKSVWSPMSAVPMDNFSCLSQVTSTNNYIDVDFTGVDEWLMNPAYLNEIRFVEIGVIIGSSGLLQSVVVLDRCEFGIHRSWYNFYNTNTLTGVDPAEATKLFDAVPWTHHAEGDATPANVEGTRAFLANTVEGADNICINAQIETSWVAQEECQELHSVTFDIIVQNQFATGGGKPQGIWQLDSMDYPVYGGLTDKVAFVTDLVNDMDTGYLQAIPEGGFTVYPRGMDVFDISIQEDFPLPKQDSYRNVYDVTKNSQRNDVRDAFVTGTKSTATISRLKPGTYIFCIASPFVSFGDKLGYGSYYDLNNNQKWQQTSCPMLGVDDGSGFVAGTYEIRVTIAPGDPATITGGTFYVQDLSDVRPTVKSSVAYGYLIDGLLGTDDPEKLNRGLRVERQRLTVDYDIAPPDPAQCVYTDHNGFWWIAMGGIAGAAPLMDAKIAFDNGDASAKSTWEKQYEGTLADLQTGTGLTKTQFVSHGGTSDAKFYIVYVTNPDYRPVYSTSMVGVLKDTNGYPVQGILVAPVYCGRPELTDSYGGFNIIVYQQYTDPTVLAIGMSTGTQCCVELPTVDDYGYIVNTQPNPIYPLSSTAYKDFGDIIVTISSTSVISIWKRGGRRQFGIAYYDDGNRSTTVQTDETLIVTTPFWTQFFGDPLAQNFGIPVLEWTINHLPPQPTEDCQFTHYVWVVSDDTAYTKYVQFVTDTIKYMVFYNSDTEFEETSYSSNTATQIFIGLQSITYFNNANPGSTVGYTYQAGDRLRFIQDPASDVGYVESYIDVPILGQFGDYISIEALNKFPEITKGMLIEVYHPGTVDSPPTFYEFGQMIPLVESGGIWYHGAGVGNPLDPGFTPQAQDSGQPATGAFPYGDTWYHARRMNTKVQGSQQWIYDVESEYLSDFFQSKILNYGRPNLYDANAKKKRIEGLTRFSNVYRPDTNIVGFNEFEQLNRVIFPQYIGAIEKLSFVNNVLCVNAQNEFVTVYLGMGIITEATGTPIVSVTNSVIGQFRVIGSKSGCENPESVVAAGDHLYWYNRRKGQFMRYASNEPFPVSDKGYRNFFLQSIQNLVPGSRVLTAYNYRYNSILCTITVNEGEGYTTRTLNYNIGAEVWEPEMSIYPTVMGQTIYGVMSYVDGLGESTSGIWQHDMDADNPNSYYGEPAVPMQFDAVFNTLPDTEKVWKSIGVESLYDGGSDVTNLWFCPAIEGINNVNAVQSSELSIANFVPKNSEWRAALLRDSNTPNVTNPIINGSVLRSRWLRVRFQVNEVKGVKLVVVSGYFIGSPRSAT